MVYVERVSISAHACPLFTPAKSVYRYENAYILSQVLEYIDLETEPDWKLPSDPLATSFPQAGTVQFEAVSLRYRPGLPLALADATFTVPGGSQCGVCGRTGAGKSTLAAALFRLTEVAAGRILIDGVDIAGLGLHTLRRALAVIPQDPTL